MRVASIRVMADHDARVFQLAGIDTAPIERIEQEDGTVRYTHLKLLSPGIWRDGGSEQTIWYSPEGIRNLEVTSDNVVNVMHDVGNDVASVGQIDPESVETDDEGNLYGDVVLSMDNAASKFTDENLQETLKSSGAKGFGGPSVEISADGQQVEYNHDKGLNEMRGGRIDGLGFVSTPASRPVDFSRQTAQRAVALTADGGDTDKAVYHKRALMDPEELRQTFEQFGLDTSGMDDEDLVDMADELGAAMQPDESEMEDGEDEEPEEDDEEEEEPPEMEDGEDDEEEEEDTEMQDEALAVVQEQLEELRRDVESMKDNMMGESDVSESLSEAREELADAETAQELSEAVEGLEARLSSLEDEPKAPKSLSDGESGEIEGEITSAGSYDSLTNSYSR